MAKTTPGSSAAPSATVAGGDLDDATLVVRAQEGDVRAYELLVRRYQGAMYRLAVQVLGNSADAEDVLQEAFLTAWRRLGQLQDRAAFAGWLYKVTTNRCLNLIRRRKPSVDADPDTQESADAAARPDRAAETSLGLDALARALQRIAPQQRACWVLREVHGRSYEEIAEATGATTSAVRGRIARARAELARVMAPWR